MYKAMSEKWTLAFLIRAHHNIVPRVSIFNREVPLYAGPAWVALLALCVCVCVCESGCVCLIPTQYSCPEMEFFWRVQ